MVRDRADLHCAESPAKCRPTLTDATSASDWSCAIATHPRNHTGCSDDAGCRIDRRALALWPGIDRRALARCRHDVARIVSLVCRRSRQTPESIRALLGGLTGPREEGTLWFG